MAPALPRGQIGGRQHQDALGLQDPEHFPHREDGVDPQVLEHFVEDRDVVFAVPHGQRVDFEIDRRDVQALRIDRRLKALGLQIQPAHVVPGSGQGDRQNRRQRTEFEDPITRPYPVSDMVQIQSQSFSLTPGIALEPAGQCGIVGGDARNCLFDLLPAFRNWRPGLGNPVEIHRFGNSRFHCCARRVRRCSPTPVTARRHEGDPYHDSRDFQRQARSLSGVVTPHNTMVSGATWRSQVAQTFGRIGAGSPVG